MWSTNLSEGLLEICNSFEASEGERKIWSLQFCFVVKVRNATLGVKGWTNVNSLVRLLIARSTYEATHNAKTCQNMLTYAEQLPVHQNTPIDSGGSDLMNSAAVPRLPGFSSQRVCSELFLLLGTLESSRIRSRFWRMSSCSATDLLGEIFPWLRASEGILWEISNVNALRSYQDYQVYQWNLSMYIRILLSCCASALDSLDVVAQCHNIQSLLLSSMSISRTTSIQPARICSKTSSHVIMFDAAPMPHSSSFCWGSLQ